MQLLNFILQCNQDKNDVVWSRCKLCEFASNNII